MEIIGWKLTPRALELTVSYDLDLLGTHYAVEQDYRLLAPPEGSAARWFWQRAAGTCIGGVVITPNSAAETPWLDVEPQDAVPGLIVRHPWLGRLSAMFGIATAGAGGGGGGGFAAGGVISMAGPAVGGVGGSGVTTRHGAVVVRPVGPAGVDPQGKLHGLMYEVRGPFPDNAAADDWRIKHPEPGIGADWTVVTVRPVE